MSGGPACSCGDRSQWRILDYKCNYSKFSGSRYTPSDYSAITCNGCGRVWRTKAAYVDDLQHGDLERFAKEGKA